MTDETKAIIRDALEHREREHWGYSRCDRMDATRAYESDDPVIRGRAIECERRATEREQKARDVRAALEEFNRENDQGHGARPVDSNNPTD